MEGTFNTVFDNHDDNITFLPNSILCVLIGLPVIYFRLSDAIQIFEI